MLIDHVFASGTDAVICREYGVPVVPVAAASGPSVSFGRAAAPGLIGMMNSSSDWHLFPHVAPHDASLVAV